MTGGLAELAYIPTEVGIVDLLDPAEVRRHHERQREPVDAVPTCLPAWNHHCRDEGGGVGLARGWHVTIAATTGSGKSLMGLNLAASAIGCGERVGFLSLEMSKAQLATRLHAIITGTDVREIERGTFQQETAASVARKVAEIRERTGGGFITHQEPVFEVEKVCDLMRYMAEIHGCGVVVVDYLQLIGARDAETLYRQVSDASARVREFARSFGTITIGLSQLNRATSSDYASKPKPQGLIGSSSLENDSDQVLLFDHTRYERGDRTAKTWVILAKNRHGGQGEFPVEWDYRTLRIREALPDEEGTWPK